MKTIFLTLALALASAGAQANTKRILCGVVTIKHGPPMAEVEPSYNVTEENQGTQTSFYLSSDRHGLLRSLKNNKLYCFEGMVVREIIFEVLRLIK